MERGEHEHTYVDSGPATTTAQLRALVGSGSGRWAEAHEGRGSGGQWKTRMKELGTAVRSNKGSKEKDAPQSDSSSTRD